MNFISVLLLRHGNFFALQKKSIKENLEQSSSDLNEPYLEQAGNQNNSNEDDIVVDAIDPFMSSTDKEFIVFPGQILGLDQAVLQSIDRCRK